MIDSAKNGFDPMWDIPITGGLRCVSELRKHLSIQEKEYLTFDSRLSNDCRSYFLYIALDEVTKASTHLMRLRELLDHETKPPQKKLVSRLVTTSVFEEQHMRIRRLLELLINLVLFSSTNDQAYYRHLLLLEDLAHNSGMDKDLYDFWGQSSLRIQDYTKSQIQWIHDAESKVDLVSCWYLKNQRPILRSTVKQLAAENILSSFRSRFKQALLSLTNTERITCGYSYYWIFGTSSENIHFRSSRLDNNLSLDEWRMHIQRIGLLIYLIIDRCYQIMGKPVASQCEEISKSLENEARSSSIIRDKTVGVYELGDLVFAYGERSKIIEIKNSPYGYRTYKVNYLDDKQNKVKEDWCPAPYIQPYQPMKIIFKK